VLYHRKLKLPYFVLNFSPEDKSDKPNLPIIGQVGSKQHTLCGNMGTINRSTSIVGILFPWNLVHKIVGMPRLVTVSEKI
jgi:hypothetical protein